MEIRQLKYFVRIVELGSVSRAAADLHVAQPALSHQISNLEEELKVKLLARSVRGVTATDAGAVFYRHARAMLRQIERMRADVAHAGDHPHGDVSVGLPSSAATILAPALISACAVRYPDINLQITESLSGHLEELVVNGRIEMSLLFEPVTTEDRAPRGRGVDHLEVRPLLDEELFLMTARRDLSGNKGQRSDVGSEVTIEHAATHSLVLPGKANVTRQIIDAAFAGAGQSMQVAAELDSLATIRAVVANGLGATIGSFMVPGGTEDLDVRRIASPAMRRRLSLCTFDIMPMSSAAAHVADLIEEIAADLVDTGRWPGASRVPPQP